jgi:hypothetical protein
VVAEGGGVAWDGDLVLDAGPNTLELEAVSLPPGGKSWRQHQLILRSPAD